MLLYNYAVVILALILFPWLNKRKTKQYRLRWKLKHNLITMLHLTKQYEQRHAKSFCNAQKCTSCKSYRAALRAIYHSSIKRATYIEIDSHSQAYTNERYLRTPEKKERLRQAVTSSEKKDIKTGRLHYELNEKKGEEVDEEMNQGMTFWTETQRNGIQKEHC